MTAALMMTIGFFNTPKMTGAIAAIFIPLLSADCRGNRIKKCKRKNSWLPVVGPTVFTACQAVAKANGEEFNKKRVGRRRTAARFAAGNFAKRN